MRAFLAPILLILALTPAAVHAAEEEPSPVQWGERVSDKYRLWDWISAYTEEDPDSWPELSAAEQSAALKKAETACAWSDKARASAAGTSDAAAIMALPDTAFPYMEVCLADGESSAAALKEKKDRLALIKQKAETGNLSSADINWLEQNNLQLAEGTVQNAATQKELEAQGSRQQKINGAADKKYGALKDKKNLGSAGLKDLYDGNKSKPAGEDTAVQLSGKKGKQLAPPSTGDRSSKKKLSFAPPPEVQLTEEFKDMKGYKEMKKENTYNKVMDEVDKDGAEAAAKGSKMKTAGYATLKSVYSVSKDFDETFINNPAPKDEDVQKVIDRIKSKAKNPDEAWQIAYQMRNQRDFPALRDAEHYLYACSEANESRWKAARTVITTPMYSISKLPGLRSVFYDENTSPPSFSELGWGLKGAKDCVK